MSAKAIAQNSFARRNVILGMAAASVFALLYVVFTPSLQPQIAANHILAAHWGHQLIAAERQHAARFPGIGFTCDLHRLEQAGILDGVIRSDERYGYRFELRDCGEGKSTRFTVVALPTKAGSTGDYVFCANEQSVLWYSPTGSVEQCLVNRFRSPMPDL